MQGKSKSRTYSGSKTLKRCWNTGEADNVVLIDVDSDNMNDVIIIDAPESLKQKLRGSRTSRVLRKDRKCQLGTIIYIDDNSSDDDHSGTGVEGDVEYYSDASSSGRFVPSSEHTQNSVDAVGDECQFVRENLSPLKSSKYKRTYSGISCSRNCYGLGPDLDSGTSDNECPDCEFMEDSFGKLREQWEKANIKKKYEVYNGQSARGDEATTSGLCAGTQQNSEVENMSNQHTEAQACPSSSNTSYEEESSSFFVQRGFENFGNTSSNPKKTSFADFGLKSTQETQFYDSEAHYWVRGESIPFDPPFNNAEGQTNKHVKHGSSSFSNEEHCSRGPFLRSSCGKGNKLVNHTDRFPPDEEKTVPAEPSQSNPEPTIDISFSHCKASLLDEEVSFFRTQYSVVDHGREKFQQTPICDPHFCNEFKYGSSCKDRGKSISGKPSFQNIKRSAETRVHHDVANNEVGAVPEETSCEGLRLGKSGLKQEKRWCQNKVKRVTEEPSLFSVPREEFHTELNLWAGELSDEFTSNGQQQEKDGSLNAQDGYVVNAVQDCIINEREKLKETDEYKQAAEKEWASRQRELQLQAEEAQKLRQLWKRKKAESMRLLDMERRQKQRVEEMRETQKKDEENMNLKEQIRAEIRNEINRLEITCRDMASLLRGLGIHVGGGFQSPPTEVRAAYKRALLSFHPDRASGSNIRQLVEAEEKFKLISRMKEKLLSTS